MKIVILDNNIAKAKYKLANEIPINMSNSENMDYGNDWRTYRDKNDYLGKNRGQAYSIILGEFTQMLQDNMNQDKAWSDTST